MYHFNEGKVCVFFFFKPSRLKSFKMSCGKSRKDHVNHRTVKEKNVTNNLTCPRAMLWSNVLLWCNIPEFTQAGKNINKYIWLNRMTVNSDLLTTCYQVRWSKKTKTCPPPTTTPPPFFLWKPSQGELSLWLLYNKDMLNMRSRSAHAHPNYCTS